MGEFAVSTDIHSSIEQVWLRLADIGAISEWNPGVKESYVLNNTRVQQGLGACRHCNLGGKNFLDEEVMCFDHQRAITFRITKTNMPFESADIRFTLESLTKSTTRVICSPKYKLKYGCLGEILDSLMIRIKYENGMKTLLAALKKDVESC